MFSPSLSLQYVIKNSIFNKQNECSWIYTILELLLVLLITYGVLYCEMMFYNLP